MGTSLKSLADVKKFIKNVVAESVTKTLEDAAIEERETQQDNKVEQPVQEPEKGDEKLKPGNVSIDDVVKELNSIRSGKSLKNPELMGKMNEYFENLDENERVTLFAFMKGIAQILSGETESDQAVDNDDVDPGMKIEPEENTEKSTNTNTEKPVVKSFSKTKKEKLPKLQMTEKPPTEDTTPPASLPIKPKRRV